ncbi:MAG: hypothetical protein RLZZ232_2984 [Planctomycetota bacterium]|jgi:hypothetical protein
MNCSPVGKCSPATVEPPAAISAAAAADHARQELQQAFSVSIVGDHAASKHSLLTILALSEDVLLAGIDTVLTIFCLPDFFVAEEQGVLFRRNNVLITRLLASCLHATTDHHLGRFGQQSQAAIKTLVPCSDGNQQPVDISGIPPNESSLTFVLDIGIARTEVGVFVTGCGSPAVAAYWLITWISAGQNPRRRTYRWFSHIGATCSAPRSAPDCNRSVRPQWLARGLPPEPPAGLVPALLRVPLLATRNGFLALLNLGS